MRLIDIPVVYICPNHNQKYNERKEHMDRLLNTIGFKSITHFKSGIEPYPTCIAKATLDILKMNLNDNPVIILEDDVECFTELNHEVEVEYPDDTDAFYLGFSTHSGSLYHNINAGPSRYEKYSDKYIRILNMLSAHAILYKSKVYKQKVINAMNSIIDKIGYHSDIVISRLHSSHRIYGYYYPFFYQSSKLGNPELVERCTRFRIN